MPAQSRLIDHSAPNAAGVRPADADLTEGASGEALARLGKAVSDLKLLTAGPLLVRALQAIGRDDAKTAEDLAIQVLNHDERNGLAWHVLGIAREKTGDFKNSIMAYEAALALLDDHADVANDLGRLAFRMGQKSLAAELFARYHMARPDCPHGANNLACALRDMQMFPEAIELLQRAITANPLEAMLWNTLGAVRSVQGDGANALIFYDEALRLDLGFVKARYNRGNTRLELGDIKGALADCEDALACVADASEKASMRMGLATILWCAGRIGEAWDVYETRIDHNYPNATFFLCGKPRWEPQSDLAGKSLLLFGEQGLGDEVMFANDLPDLIDALGPEGKLTLAVEPRLVPLFQRSFPTVAVGPHGTYTYEARILRAAHFAEADDGIELWAPLASPLRRFRRSVDSFPRSAAYLRADPARIAHWRAVLAALPGPKVGLLWKSMKLDGQRLREYSPFEQWRAVLGVPGVSFVNLQYGECAAELGQAREAFGVEIWQPPGVDLKNDLDDVAALCLALDLVIAPANATSNIAAACGAPVWFITTPIGWTRLGTDHFPWYPTARVFAPERFGDWGPVMGEIADALRAWTEEKA